MTQFSILPRSPRTLLQTSLLSLLVLLGACAADADRSNSRGSLGKTELVGSCSASSCGDQSEQGTCWCDADCADLGDCCENASSACDLDQCDACLATGGTWQPEANECTSDCDIQDISCFTDSCPTDSCEASCDAGHEQVDSPSDCLQDDAVCYSLDNCGTEIFCTGEL